MLLKMPLASLVLRIPGWPGWDSSANSPSFQKLSVVASVSNSLDSTLMDKDVVVVVASVVVGAVKTSFSSRPPFVGISLSVLALSPLTT